MERMLDSIIPMGESNKMPTPPSGTAFQPRVGSELGMRAQTAIAHPKKIITVPVIGYRWPPSRAGNTPHKKPDRR